MKIELFFQLDGVGSASGLIYYQDQLFIISDNSNYLYQYSIGQQTLSRIALVENQVVENVSKQQKLDLESVTLFENSIYAFGSGSTENRNMMFEITIEDKTIVTHNLTNFYKKLMHFARISAADFNIEGAITHGGNWYFFQRGNGGTGKNGIFFIKGNFLNEEFTIDFTDISLPMIEDVETSFTDAIWLDGMIYFLAAAERTLSAYEDGDVLGTIFGTLNPQTMKVETTQVITDTVKLEGITLYSKHDNQLEFLLCEDNDSDDLTSGIYKLSVTRE